MSYTSIAHFGFIGIGIFAFTTQAGTGAVLYMVNHGLATGLLFLVVGMFVARRGSALVSDFGGAGKLVPVLAGVLFFAGLASLALPGTAPFVSEFLVLIGTFTVQQAGRGHRHRRHHPGRRVRAVDGAAHHAGHAQPGADRGRRRCSKDLSLREKVVVAPLVPAADPARLLPEAGHRRDQPGGPGDHAGRRHDRSGADGGRERKGGAVAMGDLKLPAIDYGALVADADPLRRGLRRRPASRRSLPRGRRNAVQLTLALARPGRRAGRGDPRARDTRIVTIGGAVAVDGPTLFLQGAILVLGVVALLLIGERTLEHGGAFVAAGRDHGRLGRRTCSRPAASPARTEVYPLTIFALGGMLLFVAANDLLTMFVALEVFSLPLYLLCALARRRRLLSQEAALKYFLLGAYASAFFLFGVALIYGFAGGGATLGVDPRGGRRPGRRSQVLLFAGLALVAIGLLFKAARGPVPRLDARRLPGRADADHRADGGLHQGRRVRRPAARPLRGLRRRRAGTSSRCSARSRSLTMLVGAVLAVTQTDIKRLLAYSSIANAGYLLVGVLALQQGRPVQHDVLPGRVRLLGARRVRHRDAGARRRRRGHPPVPLGRAGPHDRRCSPALFTFILLAFAGIPLTSGFTSKFAVFGAALEGGQTWLVIVGVITSMILAFPYLRVVVMMWLSEPGESTPTVSIPGVLTSAALVIGVIATLALGVVPAPLLDLTNDAAQFVR